MIRFLIIGLLRDKSRSILPVIVISIGVFLTVMLTCWITGIMGDIVDLNANFNTGHVKVMTRAYADISDQVPNDLAILRSDELLDSLEQAYPDMEWVQRIRFGGLMDIAGKNGETRAQGPAFGMSIDMFSPGSKEAARMNIKNSIISGKMPVRAGEAMISHEFAEKFNVKPGDQVTLFGSTMYGAMTFRNFIISGTVRFGSAALDRGAIIIDLKDARNVLDMDDATGEILGYFRNGVYNDDKAKQVVRLFNTHYAFVKDEFAPEMVSLRDQNQLSAILEYTDKLSFIFIIIFMCAMSVVLWNTGLLAGLRRYNEFGIRLAMGEEKKHIYKTLIYESLLVGITGSVLGTCIGLGLSFFMQEHGLQFGNAMKNASMMLPGVYRAKVVPEAYYIGFIPGVVSMVIGNALSGIGIYKRQTAQLFKELEV
jgi:putative ABC transport system permease protein